ncbi:hypothetical protein [Autumnicola edwardsiae]|uniref:D-mannonate oxidoreductase n=1 Tax=Autumnicola edwardsiae TaxID=3075594 RepID=A0ABU3CXJ4_9FLAO|nr:hypothetical protein [Zunongwangia sp. F297]MDT0651095.1 hypothetical protein [Zunongwangia sp. F297]
MTKFEELRNKVVVVAGGGGVLCNVMAESLAAQGAKVAVLDLKMETAASLSKKINDSGGIAAGFEANVLDKKA